MSLIDATAAQSPTERPAASLPYAAASTVAQACPAERGEVVVLLATRHAGLRYVVVHYELLGAAALPVVLVAGGISATRHVAASAAFAEAGWWDEQVGAGRAIDPTCCRVLAFDWVGADGALDAAIDPADQADAVAALLDALAISSLAAFVGASYGAMIGLQFAARHGARLGKLVVISGAHRPHPFASAWRALQRQVARLGAQYDDAEAGLSLARQLAILSYRTPEEFGERFDAPAQVVDGRARVAAQDYLDHCGAKYVARTPITAYLRLSESIDLQYVAPEQIRVPTTVVAVAEDRLVPIEDLRALASEIGPHARLRGIRSPYGHDAFLKEPEAIDAILRDALSTPPHLSHGEAGMSQRNTITAAVRAGIDHDEAFGAVTPPLVLSSNFSFRGFNDKRQYDYTRSGNPTRDLLGEALAELEGGAGSVITATGMGAITVVLHAFLKPGDTLVVPHDAYGGSWRLFNALANKGAFNLLTVDLTDPRALTEALAAKPALVWIETPSNPLLRVTDLRFVIEAAHAVGALAVVDNTFLSPALQRPIDFGADFVVHSTTKYINGHSDVVGGAVVARDAERHQLLTWWANCLGLTGSPFDSFLTLRGLRTLDARLRVHQENTAALVALLDGHAAVCSVHYPGLATHPGHALAARQQQGFGAMLSVELEGGVEAVQAFLDGLQCFTLAESLGGVESLVAHPATMTHAAMSAEARAAAGIGDGLLRLSVGIEHVDDLVADIAAALERAQSVAAAAKRVAQ